MQNNNIKLKFKLSATINNTKKSIILLLPRVLFSLSFLSLSFLSSCAQHNKPYKNANTLYIDIANEPSSLDPALAEDWYSYRVVNDLFAGLIDFDTKNHPILGMASKLEILNNGRTYKFYLKNNLRFSDGSKITADDFVYSWRRLLDPKTASSYSFLLDEIVNAKLIRQGKLPKESLGVIASKTNNSITNNVLLVNLNSPSNKFLNYLTSPNTFVVSQNNIKQYGDKWTNPKFMVTSGAYILKERVNNSYILTQKNPYFYEQNDVKINFVKYFPYVDSNTSIANYRTNALDMTGQMVPVNQYLSLKSEYKDAMHTAPWERIEFLNFNMRLEKYKNLKLRKALSLAIDRDIITNKVLFANQKPLYSIISSTIEDGKYKNIEYDFKNLSQIKRQELAKQLYQEAGYSSTNPLTIVLKYKTSDMYKKISTVIAAMWSYNLGVHVVLQNQEWKTLVSELHSGNYDIAFGGWGADYNLVDTYTDLFLCDNGNNNTHYCNLKYDALIMQAKNNNNIPNQHALYTEAIQLMLNDYSIIPLFQPTHQRLITKRVKNYDMEVNYLDNVQSKWMYLSEK